MKLWSVDRPSKWRQIRVVIIWVNWRSSSWWWCPRWRWLASGSWTMTATTTFTSKASPSTERLPEIRSLWASGATRASSRVRPPRDAGSVERMTQFPASSKSFRRNRPIRSCRRTSRKKVRMKAHFDDVNDPNLLLLWCCSVQGIPTYDHFALLLILGTLSQKITLKWIVFSERRRGFSNSFSNLLLPMSSMTRIARPKKPSVDLLHNLSVLLPKS